MRLLAAFLGLCAVGVWLVLVYGEFWNGLDLTEPLGPERESSAAGIGLTIALLGCVLGALAAWKRRPADPLICPVCGQEFAGADEYAAHYDAFHSAA